MDDVLEHVLEHVAFSGNLGLTIDQLWASVSHYFQKHNIHQNIDQPYKELIWSLLRNHNDVIMGTRESDVKGIPKVVPMMDAPTDRGLNYLVNQHGNALVFSTTEERQWLALTGRAIDYKSIPNMVFVCLSAISGSKEKGITLMDIYRQTGQDKRSAPARCKKLQSQGLVKGYPILSGGTNTTLYVHYRFLAENAAYREQQADFGGKSRALDLHLVRRGISDLLSASTSRILKIRDCCTLMKMTSAQTDPWTQRRFYAQLHALENAGYVRLVRVPGKYTGDLIACVELLKEYTDADITLVKNERHLDTASQRAPVEDELEIEQDEDFSNVEPGEELDLGAVEVDNRTPSLRAIAMTKDRVLELSVQEAISAAGRAGLSGPELRNKIVGEYWSRPFDEHMKRLCPTPDIASQPLLYAYLSIAPAIEEIVGRTRQYRYFSTPFAPHSYNGISSNEIIVSAGESVNDSQHKTTTRDSSSTHLKSQKRKHDEVVQEVCRNRVENSTSAASRRKPHSTDSRQVSGQTRTDHEGSTESAASPTRLGSKRNRVQLNTPQANEQDSAMLTTSVASLNGPGNTENADVSDSARSDNSSRGSRKAPSSKRDLLRKGLMNSTTMRRRALVTRIIESAGGVLVLDPDFLLEYDKLLLEEYGIRQTTDRSTLKKTLNELTSEGRLHGTSRMLANHTGRTTNRRDIYFLSSIDPDGAVMKDFIEQLKLKEASKKQVSTPHKILEIAARPEMDIIPTVAQANRNKSTLGSSKLTPEEVAKLRVRLTEKESANSPSSPAQWFAGDRRIYTLKELREQRKERIMLETKAADDLKSARKDRNTANRPKIRRPPRLRPIPANESSDLDLLEQEELERSVEDEESLEEDTVTAVPKRRPRNAQGASKLTKKGISKRADRFTDQDNLASADNTASEPVSRRPRYQFTDAEDDAIIRAANISMIFFSKSSLQAKIDWDVINLVLPHRTHDDCKRRYATIRNRQKHKVVQNFMQSDTFAQLYNEAVVKGTLQALPSTPSAHDRPLCDVTHVVEFSRHFDPERRLTFSEPLPASMQEFDHNFQIKHNEEHSVPYWTDSFFGGSSNNVKRNILASNAFCVLDGDDLEAPDPKIDHCRAMIKSLLLTPEAAYDAPAAEQALRSLATEAESEQLLMQMIEDSLVVGAKGNEQRVLPGRSFQLSDRFFQKFRSPITNNTLRLADEFDSLLRDSFQDAKSVLYPQLANNGTSAATIELAIRGNLRLEQGRKDWGPHGLIRDYSVRQIEGHLLDFDIILTKGTEPWPSDRPAVKINGASDVPCFWIDIHGKLMPDVYRKALIVVLGMIMTRGQICEVELFRQSRPVFERHELRKCLKELAEGKFIKEHEGLFSVVQQYYQVAKAV